MNTKVLTITLTIVTLGIVGTAVFLHSQQDYDRPVIAFANENLKYWENMDSQLLLDGVTAYDENDGDVTTSLIIEKVITNKEENAVMVTYAARDLSNNVCKVTRKWDIAITIADLDYDNTDPVHTVESEEEIADAGDTISDNATISSNTEQIETDAANEAEGETLQTQEEELTPEELAQQQAQAAQQALEQQQPVNAAPTLQMAAGEANITAGSAFDPYAMVGAVSDDIDTEEILRGRVQVEGEFNPGAPGDYTLTYYVVDTAGALSEKSTLVLHVTQ